jgi:hypothetical protein
MMVATPAAAMRKRRECSEIRTMPILPFNRNARTLTEFARAGCRCRAPARQA